MKLVNTKIRIAPWGEVRNKVSSEVWDNVGWEIKNKVRDKVWNEILYEIKYVSCIYT